MHCLVDKHFVNLCHYWLNWSDLIPGPGLNTLGGQLVWGHPIEAIKLKESLHWFACVSNLTSIWYKAWISKHIYHSQ